MLKFQLTKNVFLNKKELRKICNKISKIERIKKNIIFDISIINDNEMKKICKKYYKNKKTTDVLSFKNEYHFNESFNLIGEIFINNDKVISQSKELNHSYQREMTFLIIHGILHLLGYDHQNKDDEKIMFDLQYQILKKLKIKR